MISRRTASVRRALPTARFSQAASSPRRAVTSATKAVVAAWPA
jgi:hypothetical protein